MTLGYNISITDVKEQKPINSSYGNPPEEEWNKTFGGSNKDYGWDALQTNDGGYILAGVTNSFSNGCSDSWLIKTDANGTEQWSKTFGGGGGEGASSVKEIDGNGYIISGSTASYGAGMFDIWLVKTDINGNEQWNKTYGGAKFDMSSSLQLTKDSGYIITGSTELYEIGNPDIWLIKTDSNGNEEWNKTFGGAGRERGESVQNTIDGGYIIAGYTTSFGTGGSNVWIIKTDEYGNVEWNLTFGEINWSSVGYSIDQTNDRGYIVTGIKYQQYKGEKLLLLKIDENGTVQWNRTHSRSKRDFGYSIQQTFDEGYIITGETLSPSGGGYCATWLIKTDKYGNEQWNKTFYKTLHSRGQSVTQTNDGGYVIAGETDFYGSELGNAWLIKVGPENFPPSIPIIEGSSRGKVGIEYYYNFTSVDPEDKDLFYFVDWGDGTVEDWIGPYHSGEMITLNHNWNEEGTYTIKAKAKDINGAESDWAEFEVTMQRDKAITSSLFLRFLERFPILKTLFLIF